MNNGEFKYCVNCGAKLKLDAQFCNKCGAKQPSNGSNSRDNSYNAQQSYANDYNSSQNQVAYNGSNNPGLINSTVYWLKNSFKPNQCMGRADYWWGTFSMTIVFYIISIILLGIMNSSNGYYGPTGLFYFALLIYILLTIVVEIMCIVTLVERLHDTGHSGYNWLWSLTGIGGFYVLFLILQPTNWNENRWPRPNLK